MEELSKAKLFRKSKELDLTGNFRPALLAQNFGKGIKANKSLVGCGPLLHFGDEGIFALVDAVMEHGNIEHLDIMWNDMSNKGSSAIATLLRVNRKLNI